ncbi:MAG: pilus assembly protein [Burkholderiales bacterium]|nr:pilus assembly protein [Burkholderiales bacterium]
MINWKERIRAAAIHLGISLAVAALAALLVFGVWYPYPYRDTSGGRELFFIVVTVDVILGPLITLAVFDRAKTWRLLRRDLAVIGLIQLAALGYGLWTVFVARPVHLVFEIDRFRVVHEIEVPDTLLPQKPPGIEAFPMLGPTLLSVRQFKSSNESMDATLAAVNGMALGARPDLWQPYDAARAEVRLAARPVTQLKSRFPARAAEIDAVLARMGRSIDAVAYLPMIDRKSFWTIFVDPATGDVLGFMPLDPY